MRGRDSHQHLERRVPQELLELLTENGGLHLSPVFHDIVQDLGLLPRRLADIGRVVHHHNGDHGRNGEYGRRPAVHIAHSRRAGANKGRVGAWHSPAGENMAPVQLSLGNQRDDKLEHLGDRPGQDGQV